MNRNNRAQLAEETITFVTRGWYETADGCRIEITQEVAQCLGSTRLYNPNELDGLAIAKKQIDKPTRFDVFNETSLSAARRIVVDQACPNTLCLNFASAKNPGGGFLGGSQAQEESLARSSALYASLVGQQAYYETNRACGTALYTDHIILSPGVPIFRDDLGNLLSDPYPLSIVTCPAVNAGAVRKNECHNEDQIRPAMAKRIANVLAVASHHGYEHLILGAWGCGVFRNDPAMIAELFANELLDGGSFCNQFASITFAVLDGTNDQRIVTPFNQHFLQGGKQ